MTINNFFIAAIIIILLLLFVVKDTNLAIFSIIVSIIVYLFDEKNKESIVGGITEEIEDDETIYMKQ